MELDLESMTETYVLSLEESQGVSSTRVSSRRVTASRALLEDTPSQSELKALLVCSPVSCWTRSHSIFLWQDEDRLDLVRGLIMLLLKAESK